MPEDPVWTYFDAQHRFIVDQMKKSYQTAVVIVQRMTSTGYWVSPSLIRLFRQARRSSGIRVPECHRCRSIGHVHCGAESGKAGSSHTYAGPCLSPLRPEFMLLSSSSAAQSGGHEVWSAVFDLVKNISEVMMSALPNFWKIAKGFLEGKYKKVRGPHSEGMVH
jgi:exocyst complex component 2